MPETFRWAPAPQAQGDTTFAVRKASFGDGYVQAVANGINNRSESWPLTFVGDYVKITAIKAFLDARGGSQSFYWTPPMGTQTLFRCEKYSRIMHSGMVCTLMATFEQSFTP